MYRLFRIALLLLALAGWMAPAQSSRAEPLTNFDLPAQPLGDALRAVGIQASMNILFDPAIVEGRVAPALKAHITVNAALNQLLVGSGLTHQFVDERTIAFVLKAAPAAITKVHQQQKNN